MLEMVEKRGLARLVSREATSMTIEVQGVLEVYDIIKVHEFTSDRKMMSIIVKERATGDVRVFCKGASD